MAKVFDSSAVLAALYGEPGGDKVKQDLPGGVVSSVNASEIITVLMRKGAPFEEASAILRKTLLKVQDFTLESALKTASLRSPQARSRGLSLGDRACLATGLLLRLPVVTAERNWTGLSVPGLKIETIRP
jgi:PIN domain nuclease of toxin-antitoxin system